MRCKKCGLKDAFNVDCEECQKEEERVNKQIDLLEEDIEKAQMEEISSIDRFNASEEVKKGKMVNLA